MRYIAGLKRNAWKHEIGIAGVHFSDSVEQRVELDDKAAAAVKAGIDAASAPDGKCPGIKSFIVFEAESVPAPKPEAKAEAPKPAAPAAAPRARTARKE